MGNNIVLPYSGHIPGGIHVGTDVVISGRVPNHSNGFSVNLCLGPTYNEGCALHFNPRIDRGVVVRNHMQGGAWGNEETQGGMPFRRVMGFEMHMKVTHHGYKITVNHKHYCDFHHRLPKEHVQYIYIEGEVHINFIQFRGGTTHPTPAFPPAVAPAYPPAGGYVPPPASGYPPAGGAPAYPGGGAGSPIFNPPVPFTSGIPGGLYPGKIIYLSGTPSMGASRFTVNILCGPSDQYDIAMHFDVRFNYGDYHNKTVRTHKQGNAWGQEEVQQTYFPFMHNAPFEIMILAEPSSFKVAVNNQHYVEFFHRIQPMQRATHVGVVGDVMLSQVRFQ